MCKTTYLGDCPVLHGAAFPMLATDTAGQIVAWNVACTRLFQWRSHEAVGMNIKELIACEETRTKHDGFISGYVHGKRSKFVGLPGSPSLGKQRHMRARRKDGKILAVMVGISDVRCKTDPEGRRAVMSVSPDEEEPSWNEEDEEEEQDATDVNGKDLPPAGCPAHLAIPSAGCPYYSAPRHHTGKAEPTDGERFFLACFADLTEPERVKNALLVACYDAQCTVTRSGDCLTVTESSPQLDDRFGHPLAGLDLLSLCATMEERKRLLKFFNNAHAQSVSAKTIDFRCRLGEAERVVPMDMHCVQMLLSPGAVLLCFTAMQPAEVVEEGDVGDDMDGMISGEDLDGFSDFSQDRDEFLDPDHQDDDGRNSRALSG
eukprot:TRINITY_DN17228_c0_g2_i2.p1 TRINITY_DN17228_c0_g2~~TRINITY_DN17228_c0_g2_i2.p1  ORF type:complete len:374 (+),score=77.90 TRINITY_DN17228_c0_g2_i2:66-1187(+)